MSLFYCQTSDVILGDLQNKKKQVFLHSSHSRSRDGRTAATPNFQPKSSRIWSTADVGPIQRHERLGSGAPFWGIFVIAALGVSFWLSFWVLSISRREPKPPPNRNNHPPTNENHPTHLNHHIFGFYCCCYDFFWCCLAFFYYSIGSFYFLLNVFFYYC